MVEEARLLSIDGQTNVLLQWEYISQKKYTNPFDDIELDIKITSPTGDTWIIPTFWIKDQCWGVRFIPKDVGEYQVDTLCTDTQNASLHQIKNRLTIVSSKTNKFPPTLQQDSSHSYLVDENQKPFLWLSDTWWMALSSRLSFPKEFKRLTDRRKNQGFNVVMLVAGLMPDMDSFDERCANEAGLPWQADYTQINPLYFDKADERIAHLIQEGIIPCILGSWGYYLEHMGEEKMKQHWRYIIARWGAYPVVWCIAGEATMPYYLSKNKKEDRKSLKLGWTKIAHYIRTIDPYHRLLTVHPTEVGREQLTDDSLLDLNLLQASHHGYASVSTSIKLLTQERKKLPSLPLIMSEMNYEGILHDTHDAVQRLSFWSAILSGSKGYGYGANGVWQVNTSTHPFGASPHGAVWGDTPWQESYNFKGASHIGYAKKMLENYRWWELKPLQHLLSPSHDLLDPKAPRCAGITDELRMIYFYGLIYPWQTPYIVKGLNSQMSYFFSFWNPRTGVRHTSKAINISKEGECTIPTPPTLEDWVIIIQCTQEKKRENPTTLDTLKYHYHTKLKIKFKQWFT